MALVLKLLYTEIIECNRNFNKDPRVKDLPLVGSPIPPFIVLTLYLLFVKKWGPNWMNNRKPYDMKSIVQIFNVLQIVANGCVFIGGLWNYYLQKDFSLTCKPIDYTDTSPTTMRLMYFCYLYYVTKFLDLFDTIIFVLRKKWNQITFLHLYHHCVMVFGTWLYMSLMMASHGTVLGIVNSLVHVVMYSYYLASSMSLKMDLIPWKKKITQIQILQFCYLVGHFAMPVFNNWCNTPLNIWNAVAMIQNIFMALMFLDFYFKAYVKKRTN